MLTEEQIYECEDAAGKSYRRHKYSVRGQQITPADNPNWHIARAIEAEVRKADTALIRQLVDALDTAFHQTCSVGRPKDWEQIRNALHSARARLEDAK